MFLADISHLSVRLHKQTAWVADSSRCENKFADFELFDELLFQESRTLLFIERDQNPVLLSDLPEQFRVGG